MSVYKILAPDVVRPNKAILSVRVTCNAISRGIISLSLNTPLGDTPFESIGHKVLAQCPDGGVAQWTLYPPQEQEDPGSNPARV
jgi:hypothetical protein